MKTIEIKIQLKVITGLGIDVEGGSFLLVKSNLDKRKDVIKIIIGNK